MTSLKRPVHYLSFCAALLSLLVCSCQTPVQTTTVLPNQPALNTPVALSPGDVIKLTFSGSPELNQEQKVRADGKVSLPFIGEVSAAGKRVSDFQRELNDLYKPQLRNSLVLVTLESGVASVIVSGYVTKPGKLTFDRPTTVFQAIMEAGGATEYGNMGKVRLVRTVQGQHRGQLLDLRGAMTGQDPRAIYVRDGDVIYVPQSLF